MVLAEFRADFLLPRHPFIVSSRQRRPAGSKSLLIDGEQILLRWLPRVIAHQALNREGLLREGRKLLALDAQIAQALWNSDRSTDSRHHGDRQFSRDFFRGSGNILYE